MELTHLRTLDFDADMIARHDGSGPRYTSYPTADRFESGSVGDQYIKALRDRDAGHPDAPLSLYVHIPFCDTVCYYCACNKIVTKHKTRADAYLDDLEKEIRLIGRLFHTQPVVSQLHFGGGTPTFLTYEQMHRLLEMLRAAFTFTPDAECSVEIDPRRIESDVLALLASYGFNRMSLGVQDVDPAVQKAINRMQPDDVTEGVLRQARDLGYQSINMDLIYGLPLQNAQTMRRTLKTVLGWRPDRIALYSYAHLPERFKPQRRIDSIAIPSPAAKLEMLKLAVTTLLDAGYVYIGMDHFALPNDELAQSLDHGTLQRNFQGYSTRADCDLIGLGVSAISRIGPVYAQNAKTLEQYHTLLERNELPIIRGLAMSRDDEIRRDAIHDLLCQSELSFNQMQQRWSIDAPSYFEEDLRALEPLVADELVQLDESGVRITPKGRFVSRVVAMRFDRYLRTAKTAAQYSRVI
jgi:oxygen-independent coproporphyrinogen III oxidase